jgi:hypothetical protein
MTVTGGSPNHIQRFQVVLAELWGFQKPEHFSILKSKAHSTVFPENSSRQTPVLAFLIHTMNIKPLWAGMLLKTPALS